MKRLCVKRINAIARKKSLLQKNYNDFITQLAYYKCYFILLQYAPSHNILHTCAISGLQVQLGNIDNQ